MVRLAQGSPRRRRLENAPGFAIIVNSQGGIDESNEQLLRFLGKTAAQACDSTLPGLTHPEDLPTVSDVIDRAIASGDPYEVELRLQGADAGYRWFRASGIPLRAKRAGLELWYVLLTDVDDRKRVEADLRERERQLRRSEALMSEGERLSQTGSFYWNTETNEVLYSEESYRIHEIELGTTITLELGASRWHPEDRPLMQQKIESGRNDRGDLNYSVRLLLPSGKIRWIHTNARRFRNEAGTIEYVGAIQDITERHDAEEALDKLRAAMAHVARVSSLGALAASIAHEINQPLTGVITNANTSQRKLTADPPNVIGALETLSRMLRDADRAASIVARLRAMFSNHKTDYELLDLNEAVREIVALCTTELQNNRVMVHMELDPALPAIHGDRIQLQQVVLNLILNASEAMKSVTTRPRELLLMTSRLDDGRLQLTVTDTGEGINPDAIEALFEPFRTTKSKGMGIGLFVSRSIIAKHGGRIWAELNEPYGARFCFSVPSPKR